MKTNCKPLFVVLAIMATVIMFLFLISCDGEPKTYSKESGFQKMDSAETNLVRLKSELNKSDTTILSIETAIQERNVLKKENVGLKQQLQITKDSLAETKKQIKKRTLIQKILGINKDTTKLNDTTI